MAQVPNLPGIVRRALASVGRRARLTGYDFCDLCLALLAAPLLAAPAPYHAPRHTKPIQLADKLSPADLDLAGQQGTTIEHDRGARWTLAEHRRLDAALAAIRPEHRGAVDAFVLVAALDSDPVFGREAREAGRVLTRRYNAQGHSIVLAGSDGATDTTLPMGSVANIAAALARISEAMRPQDVLVLYTTSHGAPFGIVYNDEDRGFGVIGPSKLVGLLNELGIRRRMLLISACYSGVFVGPTITPDTAIMTAASSERSSFGCQADNDWTFFGDAMINHALRKNQAFGIAAQEARETIAKWEKGDKLLASEPQIYVGDGARDWLPTLERGLPQETAPTGRPATDTLKESGR